MSPAIVSVLICSAMVAQAHQDSSVLKQGAALVEQGRLAEAEKLYENATSESRSNPELAFQLATVYFREHKWAAATEKFKDTLHYRPHDVKALFYLSESYYMQSDLVRARESIAIAARLAPDDPQICEKYGEYLGAKLETRKDGIFWLQKARHLDPALKRIEFEIGKAQFDLTDFQSAASSLEIALKRDPSDGEAAFYLAESLANLGFWEKARDFYKQALDRQYVNAPVYYGFGRSLLEMGEFASALVPLQRAIELDPSLNRAHFQLAKAYRQLGRTKEATHETRLFSELVDRIDTSRELNRPEAKEAWEKVKPLLEANKEQQALELLAKLPVVQTVEGPDAHYLLGVMYFSMGRPSDAERLLTVARTANMDSAHISAYLGLVQLSLGEADAAENSLQTALARNAAESLALIGMGGLRYQQGRWAEAADYLEKSRTADASALFMLCDAYFKIGNSEAALLTAEVIRALASANSALLNSLDALLRAHNGRRAKNSQR